MAENEIPDDLLEAYALLIAESVTPEERQAKAFILRFWKKADPDEVNRVKKAIKDGPKLQ